MIPESGRQPVLSMMPSPGDVDIVVAAELMEAGRAVQRGLVTPDRTTLIASSHRAYGILEKTAPGDGHGQFRQGDGDLRRKAKRLVAFDMQKIADESGTVISASLFGALAGADVLPFPPAAFEATIKAGGKGVEASLRAFTLARDAAPMVVEAVIADIVESASRAIREEPPPVGGSESERRAYGELLERVRLALPDAAREMARTGLRHVVDFQDVAYGGEYLDRLTKLAALDRLNGHGGYELTREGAKYLARAMAYDDVIRVADLKTRSSRLARVRKTAGGADDGVIRVTEFMHPRAEEIVGTMPAWAGRRIEKRAGLMRLIDRLFNRGRHVRTDAISWFLALYGLAGLRRFRRSLRRHEVETAHIDAWLDRVRRTAPVNYGLAVEIIRCRRLIKGYSDTRARGDAKFDKVLAALPLIENRADAADWLRRLREAALLDEDGKALDGALKTVATL